MAQVRLIGYLLLGANVVVSLLVFWAAWYRSGSLQTAAMFALVVCVVLAAGDYFAYNVIKRAQLARGPQPPVGPEHKL